MKKLFWILVLVGVVVGAWYAWPYAQTYLDSRKSVNLDKGQTADLYIHTGWTEKEVIAELVEIGVLKKEKRFARFAEKKLYSGNNVVPGKYIIESGWSYNQLVDHLRAGNGRVEVDVTFTGSRTLDDVAHKVAGEIEASEEDLHRMLVGDSAAQAFGFDKHTFPAMFFPNTYRFQWNTSAEEFIQRMAAEFKKYWTQERLDRARAMNLSQSEVYTLASIVVSEQQKAPQEWPRIAGLYLNRTRRRMPLQSDPTAIFCLPDHGASVQRVSYEHTQLDCPYNTYRRAGIPPGPIRVVPSRSLDAVLYAEDHEYLYMCAAPGYEGLHNFAKNLSEHNRNAKKFHRWLDQEGIR